MSGYILRRLLQALVITVLLSYLIFFMMNLMPGDPLDIMISSNPKITTEDIVRLKSLYGLDKPIYVRYGNWLKDIMRGDLGYSRTYKVPVTQIIGPRLLNTMYLAIGALLLSLLIGIPCGVFSALRSNTRIDYALNLAAFAGISIPSFYLGIILIIIFSVWLGLFPASGTFTVGGEPLNGVEKIIDRIHYATLPMISLAAMQMATFMRYTRSKMMETLRMDYIRTARAKGLRNRVVIYRHGLRNALIPLVTIVAISISFIFSGAIITEQLFSYQGVGKLVYDSIIANDFNMAMVSFMITIIMVLIMNLFADIAYAFLDPRITYS